MPITTIAKRDKSTLGHFTLRKVSLKGLPYTRKTAACSRANSLGGLERSLVRSARASYSRRTAAPINTGRTTSSAEFAQRRGFFNRAIVRRGEALTVDKLKPSRDIWAAQRRFLRGTWRKPTLGLGDIYRPGISFTNPEVPAVFSERRTPLQMWAPKLGDKTSWAGAVRTKKAFWERNIDRTIENLGGVDERVAGFHELALGAVEPAATSKGSFWDLVAGATTTVTGILAKKEEAKIAQAEATTAAHEAAMTQAMRAESSARVWEKLPWILGIGGGALLIGAMVLKKRGH